MRVEPGSGLIARLPQPLRGQENKEKKKNLRCFRLNTCARFTLLIWPRAGKSERPGEGGQGLVLCQAKLLERAEG